MILKGFIIENITLLTQNEEKGTIKVDENEKIIQM